jgi:group I intron endonuclease
MDNFVNAHIYLVTNTVNGKVYVGQTTSEKNNRGHGKMLNLAYKKHGFENFKYEVIVDSICDRESLNIFERFWIRVFNSLAPNGYNIEAGGSDEQKWTEERRRKHSLALMGHRGWRRGLILPSPMKGKKFPESGKQKLSAVMTGRIGPNLGKKASGETRKKMSEAQKRRSAEISEMNKSRIVSAETRAKMSAARKGRVQPLEERQQRSEAIKAWHKQRKELAA